MVTPTRAQKKTWRRRVSRARWTSQRPFRNVPPDVSLLDARITVGLAVPRVILAFWRRNRNGA